MPLMNHLGEKFPWFPTIDSDFCRADLQCLNFCPQDVFEWNPKTGEPFVAHPFRCLPGCEICVEGCDTAAISLPTKLEFQLLVKKMRRAENKPHLL